MSNYLEVYLHNEKIGILKDMGNAKVQFTYAEDAKTPISISMPLTERSYSHSIAGAFFEGVLPEEQIRIRIAKKYQISPLNIFKLLEAIGGECAGAISLNRDDLVQQNANKAIFFSKEGIINRGQALADYPLGIQNDLRLSLAGAQDKLAVREEKGLVDQHGVPTETYSLFGAKPTTHIIKPHIRGVEDSSLNEFFCMKLGKRIQLPVAEVELWSAKTDLHVLAVKRFDRFEDKKGITLKRHQEDLCQALSIFSSDKYEDGQSNTKKKTPSIQKAFDVIRNTSLSVALDERNFLNFMIFNFLIGNCDAHGKNVSFLHEKVYEEKAIVRLAPFYDLLCTTVYPNLSRKMAMRIGKKSNIDEINEKQWKALAEEININQTFLLKQLKRTSEEVYTQAQNLKKELESANLNAPIFDKIISTIQNQKERIDNFNW